MATSFLLMEAGARYILACVVAACGLWATLAVWWTLRAVLS